MSSLDDPDATLDKVLNDWPETAPVFQKHNMVCVGCLIGPFHTITDACLEYNLDEDAFRAELRDAVKNSAMPR